MLSASHLDVLLARDQVCTLSLFKVAGLQCLAVNLLLACCRRKEERARSCDWGRRRCSEEAAAAEWRCRLQ